MCWSWCPRISCCLKLRSCASCSSCSDMRRMLAILQQVDYETTFVNTLLS